MDYRKGDRVKHPKKIDWGVGEVLENATGKSVRVFFIGGGERTLLLDHVDLIRAEGDEAIHPILDNLSLSNPSSGIKYQSLPNSIEIFLEQFPEGFYGERFRAHERDYKDKAHTLAQGLLAESELRDLLGSHDHLEIVKRALKVVNATNLVFPNEKMALKDGLADLSAQKEFAEALFALLYGPESIEDRFQTFAAVLEKINAAKWTTASYFLFVVQPDKYMFVKPTITQHAAKLCAFELNYKPQVNWLTYKSVLTLSEYLLTALADLKPRDMIDVQSFMWCIAPGTYKSNN